MARRCSLCSSSTLCASRTFDAATAMIAMDAMIGSFVGAADIPVSTHTRAKRASSACPHKSAFCKRGSVNVRFAPKATEVLRCRKTSLCANKRHMQCSKLQSIRSPRQPNREAKQACDLMGHCEFSPAIDFAHQGVDQIRTVDSRKIVRH